MGFRMFARAAAGTAIVAMAALMTTARPDGYGYPLPPPGYYAAIAGHPYGGVRIQSAPKDAEVFADGYYVGIVDNFNGRYQHLNLEAGTHRIEVRPTGQQPIAFDVRVDPGRTMTYRVPTQPERP